MKHTLLITLVLLTAQISRSQSGLLDLTYAQQGSNIFRPDHETVCNEGIMDSNGKLVLSGWMQPYGDLNRYPLLVRLDENGMPDPTFGNLGYVDLMGMPQFEEFPYFGTIAQQSNGKYLALSYNNYDGHQLIRFNSDGVIDNTFSSSSFMLHRAGYYQSMIDSQDRLLVSCFYFPDDNIYEYYGNVAVMRFSADGSLDISFGTGGMVMLGNLENDERCYDLAIDNSDNIYVAGYWSQTLGGGSSSARIYGFNSDGALRSDFGSGGVFELSMPSVYNSFNGICISSNGDVLASGTRYTPLSFVQQGLVIRLTMNGEPVGFFGTDGIHLSDDTDAEFKYIKELSDQTIAIAARVNNGDLGRDVRVSIIDGDGQPLNSFGTNGHSTTFNIGNGDDNPYGIFADGSQRIFIAGYGTSYVENPNLGIQSGYKGFVACYAHEPLISVDERWNESTFIYPNPAKDKLFLSGSVNADYSITDLTGQLLDRGHFCQGSIDVSALAPGLYLLHTESKQYRFLRN